MNWTNLPADITLRCLPYYLKGNDLISYARTCTQLYRLMFDDQFWYSLLVSEFGHPHYSGRYPRSVYQDFFNGVRTIRIYTQYGCIVPIHESETELALYLNLVRNSISSPKFSLKENVVVDGLSDPPRFRFFGPSYEIVVSHTMLMNSGDSWAKRPFNSEMLRFDLVCPQIFRYFYLTIYGRFPDLLRFEDLEDILRDLLMMISKNSLTESWILTQIRKTIGDLASRGINSDVTYRRLQN